MVGKDKVYITLEVGDKGSKVVKSFDKNTERAFENIKRKARAATASMGASLQKLKSHWMAITAAMAGAGLMVKKIIAVSIAQEKAEVALAAALKVTGEYTKDLAAHFADFASGIQKATTYGDEEVLQLMALQKNLGVATNKLEEATKMSIGLATATGRDVQSMAMYIALAQQGEFTMLRRYIPALRSTTDATEQMKIVTDFAARGFKVAEEQSKTFGGSLKQLTNLFSDLLERYGNVIVKNEAILALFKEGKAKLIELIDQFERWLKVNQDLIRQKTYESIDKIKSALSKIWTIISYDPAILEYGIVGLAIGGRKGAVIFGALGHMKTWVENLSAAFGLASAGVISFREVAAANFKELEALVKKYESSMQGQGPIRMRIEKPEKPGAAPGGPEAPAATGDYYKDQMEEWKQVTADFYDMKAAREKADLEHHKAILDEWGQVTKDFAEAERAQLEQETEEFLALEDIKAQAHQEELARYEELMAANEEYMRKYKANKEAEAESAFKTHLKMISYQKEAFAELAKGSGMAFAMYKVFSVAETLMKTYEAAQSSYAWASKWGGPPAGVAAAALAWAAGMARVAAIRSLEPAALYHEGGIVGRGSRPSRLVSPDVFAGAQRAHQGLAPDERPVIVRKDEGIFTPAQMVALGMGETGEVELHLHNHLYMDGREQTKTMIHKIEVDGILLNRLRRALS